MESLDAAAVSAAELGAVPLAAALGPLFAGAIESEDMLTPPRRVGAAPAAAPAADDEGCDDL